MSRKVVIIGGEGNGGVIAACIEDNRRRYHDDEYEVAGFLNDYIPIGGDINGNTVLGGTGDISKFLDKDYYFMYAIHMIGKGPLRERLFARINIPLDRFATIVHKSSFVAANVVLHPGAFVMANCYIGPATTIGQCTLVMANCVIGHNDYIGPCNHISAGAVISSYVTTGKFSDVCLATRVIEKISIGDYSVAGAGALVLRDIPPREIHVGSPAKFLKNIEETQG